jgi:cell division protein FtsA
MKEMIIQAVDIGTTKIAAIVARKTPNNKLEILGIGTAPSLGVKRANVSNIMRASLAVKKAVEEAEKQSGIKFTEVYVGVAGSHIKSMQHRAVLVRDSYEEMISEKDLKKLHDDMFKLALPPGDSIVEVLAQEYKVDKESGIVDPIGMPGSSVEGIFHVITGSSSAINNIRRCIEDAGLKVKDVIMQPLASAAAVLSEEEKNAGVALVDIGGGTTDIAIFVDGAIAHTAVIPLGGEIITEDIKTVCRVLREHAEKLKVLHGSAYPDSKDNEKIISIPGVGGRSPREISAVNLTGIIQARMEDILEYVLQELELSGMLDKLMGGIVLTGGGSKLNHIIQLTEYFTLLETRLGLPNAYLAPTKVKDVDNPSYATGIGLIINALNRYSSEQSEEISDDKSVEKPTIVEKDEVPVSKNPVDLKVEETSPETKQDVEPEQPVKKPKGVSLIGRMLTRFNDWVEEDLEDFKESSKK